MKTFRADLHIHTLLSPCGDLEMSPANIVRTAKRLKIDIIGITDHNSTRHCALTTKLASEEGITVLTGAEVTTKEEVHCLAFFETDEQLSAFQIFIDEKLPAIRNNPAKFGDQVVIDENEVIVDEPQFLLISALNIGFDDMAKTVHRLGGLFIPAHVDRPSFSLISQLGFIPADHDADAFEISRSSDPSGFRRKHNVPEEFPLIKSSDAHFLKDIGRACTEFMLDEATFSEIRLALKKKDGRKVVIQ